MLTDGQTTDDGVTGTLIAHLGAFGSGELITQMIHLGGLKPVSQRQPQPYSDVDQDISLLQRHHGKCKLWCLSMSTRTLIRS